MPASAEMAQALVDTFHDHGITLLRQRTVDAFARSQTAVAAASAVAAVEVVTAVAVARDLEEGELVSDYSARRGARCWIFEALITRAGVRNWGWGG